MELSCWTSARCVRNFVRHFCRRALRGGLRWPVLWTDLSQLEQYGFLQRPSTPFRKDGLMLWQISCCGWTSLERWSCQGAKRERIQQESWCRDKLNLEPKYSFDPGKRQGCKRLAHIQRQSQRQEHQTTSFGCSHYAAVRMLWEQWATDIATGIARPGSGCPRAKRTGW